MATIKGKRAKKKVWLEKQRVLVLMLSGTFKAAVIENLNGERASVIFDDGKSENVNVDSLHEAPVDEEDDPDNEEGLSGFNQYTINWNPEKTNFSFQAEGVRFYGWWRKSQDHCNREICWAVDIFVQHEKECISIESIGYYVGDPRKNLRSLNSDICAAANKWFYQRCKGSVLSWNDLLRKSRRPTIKINSVQELDTLILGLKDTRDTALRLGGRRYFRFKAGSSDVEVGVEIDLTQQAILLDGKAPPSLYAGTALDETKITTHAKPAGRMVEYKGSDDNVNALVKRLKETKDKGEARKIRAALRKMGHTGGARALAE